MPVINRIRVNNVKYNFGTQAYEDFLLKPFGRNMLYDLANGGGKSVLMLLLLQTVLPNCTLDEKQPLEKLFRTAGGSQTIHSLVEWKLDARDVVHGFCYMTTGFCARRAQNLEDGARETASIEYFNYCIFYQDYNANDIRNIPLTKGKEKITYSGLRRYLKELERDSSLLVKVFDRKGEYQAFLSDYGIYESEWEMIRGINKTEGHVRSYFESNYKTTRKVIEDLLIEEIIQKSFRTKSGQSLEEGMAEALPQNDISKTLLDMKDKLMELSRKKNEISNFDRQIELLAAFLRQIDKLEQVYASVASMKEEIFRIHQKAGRRKEDCANRAAKAKEELEQIEQSAQKLQEKMDCARYMEAKRHAMESKLRAYQLKKETEEEKAALEHAKERLRLQESMNDYLEYQEEKAKREEIAAELEAGKAEKSSLLAELQKLTFYKKKEMENQREEWETEKRKLELRYHSIKLSKQSVDEKEREISQKLAVKMAKIEMAENAKREAGERIAAAKRTVGLLILEESGMLREEKEHELECGKKEENVLKKQLEMLQEEINSVHQTRMEWRFAEKRLLQEEEKEEHFLAEYEEQKKLAVQMQKAYGAKDFAKLKGLLKEKEIHAHAALLRLEEECRYLEDYFLMLSQGSLDACYGKMPWLDKKKEYIERHYKKKVQTGREYLCKHPVEKQKSLLQEYPYLPHALIVQGGIDDLLCDKMLQGSNCFGDAEGTNAVCGRADESLLLLIRESALNNGRQLIASKDMGVLARDLEAFFDEAAAEEEKRAIAVALSGLEEQKAQWLDRKAAYEEDEKQLCRFLFSYEEAYQEREEKGKERKEKLDLLAKQQKNGQAELARLVQQKEEALQKRESLVLQLEEWKQEVATLRKIGEDFQLQEKLEEELSGLRGQKQQLELEREEILCQMAELEEESEDAIARRNEINARLERMALQWREKYQAYDMPGEYGECPLTKDQLQAQLDGKRRAYEKEHSQADDKNRLLQSYAASMDRCLRMIEGRGVSLSKLQELEKEHALYATEEKRLLMQRQENSRAKAALEKKSKVLEQAIGEWNQLQGKASQLAAELAKRYGTVQESLMAEDREKEYREDGQAQLDRFAAQAEKQKEKQESLAKEIQMLEDIQRDIARMMRGEEFMLPGKEPLLGEQAEEKTAGWLKEQWNQAEANYAAAEREQKKRKEEFGEQLQNLFALLSDLDAVPLAREIKGNIGFPKDSKETAELARKFKEVMECLALEKDRVESGIRDIGGLKDNFENQCLQRCINMKTELDRLPKYSKIMLDGEQIPMISLKIPYVKEEFYKERMSAYIDEIVANVDGFCSREERLKYIRGALSFKKLFSVIVTDMNAIRLSLYKRERVKEQSRHLRYEDAVGSTGQSQGIYIQFFIAIVNYISSINSGRGENETLGKVVFLDNPFGSAKDTYIWEPIFELLRANHVQLIVPTRGATPAITGRFDVNYLLGQKLLDGKQQTVVVDYHSSVDTKEMEYIPLEYEQESFDFIQ